MAGFVEAWGRGYELITDAFKKNGLELPTMIEAKGGVRVIIKRELFYGIQQGGRIDPKTGRLINADDTKSEPITTAKLAKKLGKSSSTIKRDMKILQDQGLVEHVGPSNGGYWKRLK